MSGALTYDYERRATKSFDDVTKCPLEMRSYTIASSKNMLLTRALYHKAIITMLSLRTANMNDVDNNDRSRLSDVLWRWQVRDDDIITGE